MDSGEVWKDITGYEGYYQASDLGRIRTCKKRKGVWNPGGLIKTPIGTHGYPVVNLCVNNKVIGYVVHRLVAETFHGSKPFKDAEVNHKNAVKTDNRADNLEWVTPKENSSHIYPMGLRKPYCRAVIVMPGNKLFKSLKAAADFIGGSSAGIGHVFRGTSTHHKGYTFRYAEEKHG